MITFFKQRRMRKTAREILHHARHVRHMREDVADPEQLAVLDEQMQAVRAALREGDAPEELQRRAHALAETIGALTPPRSFAWLRENLEILIVAAAVALGFRTYFLQPFKIPTGSMQPTLYGIHYAPDTGTFAQIERFLPVRAVRWLVTGAWYTEVRALANGVAAVDPRVPDEAPDHYVHIGGIVHRIPRDLRQRYAPGDRVVAGQLLASGYRITGDHLFVDKVRWNFVPPRRGQVMVFHTGGLTNITPNTHYIKRMVGTPGDELRIDEPRLFANGDATPPNAIMEKIMSRAPGYAGYKLGAADASYLRTPQSTVTLGPGEYFGLGDNTRNSRDSRYFGVVPEKNLVGPAFVVYWPLSSRWGLIR